MNVKGLLQVLIEGIQKHPFDFFVVYFGWKVAVPRVVGSVLHQCVHDIVARRTQSFVESGGDCDVDERVLGYSEPAGLLEGGLESVESLAVHMDGALE